MLSKRCRVGFSCVMAGWALLFGCAAGEMSDPGAYEITAGDGGGGGSRGRDGSDVPTDPSPLVTDSGTEAKEAGRPDGDATTDPNGADARSLAPDVADAGVPIPPLDARPEAASVPDSASDSASGACAPASLGATCYPVVNEVQVAGASGSADEFVELFNPCSSDISLAGWLLIYRSAAGTADVQLADLGALTIRKGQYLVFAGNSWDAGVADGHLPRTTNGSLAATAGLVALQSPTAYVDAVGYGAATTALVEGSPANPAPGSGQSLIRVPNGCDTNQNSVDFSVATPSPGRAN